MKPLEQLGYKLICARGFKGYNGVAILARVGVDADPHVEWCGRDDARHCAVKIGKATLHNFYVPAGGDIPDRDKNEKFGQKLDYLTDMRDWFHAERPSKAILVGDLNIAPREDDVWDHKKLLKVVSHTPIEVDHLAETQEAGSWVDVTRKDIPDGQLYTWWSYRAADWDAADKGRRLDHIWASADIAQAGHGSRVLRAARGWEKPSDHAPVFAQFDL